MKKQFLTVLLSITGTLLFSAAPEFQTSFFDFSRDDEQKEAIRYEFNTKAEMRLIGEHFYPEWKGRTPQHIDIKANAAHEQDIADACEKFGINQQKTQAVQRHYKAFTRACRKGRITGTFPEIPEIHSGLKEFYLYERGLEKYKRSPEKGLPQDWCDLLNLPAEKRQYRTTWIRFQQILMPSDFGQTEANLKLLRDDLDAGFKDTPALGEAVIRQLIRRDPVTGLRWLPLMLTAKTPQDPFYIETMKNFCFAKTRIAAPEYAALRKKMLEDPVGREILVTCMPEMVMQINSTGEISALTPERQAYRALKLDEVKMARELLAKADKKSLLAMYVGSQLAFMDGDIDTAGTLLNQWITEFEKGKQSPVLEARLCKPDSSFEDGKLLPADLPVKSELAIIAFLKGDFVQALKTFCEVGSWIDVAYIAEHQLSTEELLNYLKETPSNRYTKKLRYLAARKLMREYAVDEAGAYFPTEIKPLYDQYYKLNKRANQKGLSADKRAAALCNLGILCMARGMELFGTELEPDNYISNGQYRKSGFPYAVENLLQKSTEEFPEEYLRKQAAGSLRRLHYRDRAAEFFMRSAMAAQDTDLKVSALAFAGTVYGEREAMTQVSEKQNTEMAYHMLCDLPEGNKLRDYIVAHKWFSLTLKERIKLEFQDPKVRSLYELRNIIEDPESEIRVLTGAVIVEEDDEEEAAAPAVAPAAPKEAPAKAAEDGDEEEDDEYLDEDEDAGVPAVEIEEN